MPLNVCISWGAQLLQIITGFVIPRLIDRHQGQEILGIWDLGWSLVSYFTLLEAGIGSSVNRHVALYRARNDTVSVNRIVSSVALVQRAIGLFILILTLAFVATLPVFLGDQPPSHITTARWLVGILGVSVAISTGEAIFTGILTGCHRWALHHGIYAFTNLLSAVGMYAVLRAGHGVVALAIVHLSSELIGRIIRRVYAYRLCPLLSIRLRHVDLNTAQEMIRFGGKMFIGRMSQIAMNQTVSVLIASHLGPAALALFARPRSLVRQASVFSQKYAFMLVPTAATLSSKGQSREVQGFLVDATRHGLYITLPLTAFLIVCGKPLLQVWMGNHYANPWLIEVLALGFLAELAYQPLANVLLGLNLHGRPAIASILGALTAILFAYAALVIGKGGLLAVALAIAIPWSLANGIYPPIYACRKLGLPVRRFLKEVWLGPLACILPFTLCLLMGRLSSEDPLRALLVGGGLGGVALGLCYWVWVIPASWKETIRNRLVRVAHPTGGEDPDAEDKGIFCRKIPAKDKKPSLDLLG